MHLPVEAWALDNPLSSIVSRDLSAIAGVARLLITDTGVSVCIIRVAHSAGVAQCARARSDEAHLIRQHDELRAVPHLELDQQVRNVRLHRWLCQRQRLGDLSVREALRDKLEHLAFALSQVPEPLGAQFVCWNGETRKAVQQAARHRRRDKRFARGDDANGLDEFSGSDILQQKPLAPARSASTTCSSASNVVRIRIRRRESPSDPPAMRQWPPRRP